MKRFILTITAIFFSFAIALVLIGLHVFEKPTTAPAYAPVKLQRLIEPKPFFHFAP